MAETQEEATELLPTADAAFGTLTADLTERASALRWLQAPQAAPPVGYFHEALVQHPVTVTNFRGIYNDHVANHALALVLSLARGLQRYIPHQHERDWRPVTDPSTIIHLAEATALVIGVGEIGTVIAGHLGHFGMRVLGADPRAESIEGVELSRPDRLDSLLPRSDVVIMTVPETPETVGMIDARRLGLLPPGAVLVNVGRGGTVQLDALAAALGERRLAGAGLDVFEDEPLPADHPIWSAPNVLMTPHVAHVGPHLDERRFEVLRDNARRFVAGDPLRNVVDKRLWY